MFIYVMQCGKKGKGKNHEMSRRDRERILASLEHLPKIIFEAVYCSSLKRHQDVAAIARRVLNASCIQKSDLLAVRGSGKAGSLEAQFQKFLDTVMLTSQPILVIGDPPLFGSAIKTDEGLGESGIIFLETDEHSLVSSKQVFRGYSS